jgi:glutamine phosphoribosylpyrophosphate amidotransferase
MTSIKDCAFNIIYSLDGSDISHGKLVRDYRIELCHRLATKIKRIGNSYDIISPIPNTGILYSGEIARLLEINHSTVFEKSNNKRTLGMSHDARIQLNRKNFNVRPVAIARKSILFVDEALISGQTAKVISQLALSYDVANVGFAFLSPPVTEKCQWDLNHRDMLFQANGKMSSEEYMIDLKNYLQAKDLFFLNEIEFSSVMRSSKICKDCFGWRKYET